MVSLSGPTEKSIADIIATTASMVKVTKFQVTVVDTRANGAKVRRLDVAKWHLKMGLTMMLA